MKSRFCLLITLCILVLAGCKNTSQGSQKADSDKPDVQADSNAASQSDVDLRELTDLVGKSDAEVTEILGQGEETKNGEGVLLERDYTLSLLGEDADVSLAFNLYQENGNVLDQAVINLGASDLDTYAKDLTQLFGEPTETHENSYFFVSDGKTLVLADPYGDGAYIEISMNH